MSGMREFSEDGPVDDVLTLQNTAAECRRLAEDSADPHRRDAYLELALVLESALRRLGNFSTAVSGVEADGREI